MGQDSKIEWTDHTFNPWWGCTHVHEGCRNCYAESWAKRFGVTWGPSGVRRVASEKQWAEPLKWNRRAEKAGVCAKVFCASMADVFEDWQGPMIDAMDVEIVVCHGCNKMTASNMDCQGSSEKCGRVPRPATMDDVRKRLFELIDQTPWLDWQLVTKRPENIRRMWPMQTSGFRAEVGVDRKNVWLLTSVSDQASAEKQIPELMKCSDLSPVLGLSCEPLLGPIQLDRLNDGRSGWIDCLGGVWGHGLSTDHQGDGTEGIPDGSTGSQIINWVIVGGESGPHARPMHPDWARSLRDQCQTAGVPFFFKQWGEWSPLEGDPGRCETVRIDSSGRDVTGLPGLHSESDAGLVREGKKIAGRMLDGRTWDEFPEEIRSATTNG